MASRPALGIRVPGEQLRLLAAREARAQGWDLFAEMLVQVRSEIARVERRHIRLRADPTPQAPRLTPGPTPQAVSVYDRSP